MTTTDDPMATVRQYIDAFNRGDLEAMGMAFTVPGSIIDGLPPHVWHGPAVTLDWYRDVMAEGAHAGASDYVVALGEPRHMDVAGDRAYGVVTQSDATFTVALRRQSEGWRIAAWAWAKGGQN
jgi:hypothetical protein